MGRLGLCPALALWLLHAAGADIIRVPMQRMAETQAAPRLHAVTFLATPTAGRSGAGATSIPIRNYDETQFYGPIQVGGKTFNVIFDTASANVWVPSRRCSVLDCWFHPRYNRAESATYAPDGRIYYTQYGSALVEGILGKDTVTLGNIEVEGQGFAEITKASFSGGPFTFAFAKFDGVLGLGFRSLAEYLIPTPFESMIERGLVDEPVFAFHLPRGAEDAGLLMLGGIDRAYYTGELVDVPLTGDTFWEVGLESLSLGEASLVASEPARGIIDSGASVIVGPNDAVAALARLAGADTWGSQNYKIRCDAKARLPDLVITLGGKNFSMAPDEYIIDTGVSREYCVFGFMSSDLLMPAQDVWLLGLTFLRKFFCVFDYGGRRLRIAPAAQVDGGAKNPTVVV